MLNADYIQALPQQFNIDAEQFILYDQNRDSIQKQFICQYLLRGTCCFTSQFCHFAHGIQYLKYNIDSITNLKPYPSLEDVKLKYRIDGYPQQYFVVEKFQSHPEVKQQLKQYHEFIGKYYDPNKVYTLSELRIERSIKQIILNTIYLLEIKDFYEKILELLQVKIIPKALLIHELNRVGYSFMGSHFSSPKTLIFHLENSGTCFSKTLKTDLIIHGYLESILRKQNIVTKQQEQNENLDDNEEENEYKDLLETKEGDKEIAFLIKVEDKQNLVTCFNLKLFQILQENPEIAKLKDINDFHSVIDKIINQIDFKKQQQILPSLNQILLIKNQIWDEYAGDWDFNIQNLLIQEIQEYLQVQQ